MDKELEQLTKTYKAGIIDDKEFEKGKARIQERLSSVEQMAKKDEEGKKIITEILGERAEAAPKKKEAKPRAAEEKPKPAEPKVGQKPKAKEEAFTVIEPETVEEKSVAKPKPKPKPKKQAKKKAKKVARAKKKPEKDEYEEEDSTLSKVIIIAGVVCIILLLVLVKVFTGNTAPVTTTNMTAVNKTVEMKAFMDFTCQYSSEEWNTLIALKDKYKGNLTVSIRYFPLSMQSVAVSNAIQCASDQGKHMDFITRLFKEQGNVTDDSLKNIAWAVGLDRNIFDACVDDQSHLEDVKKSLREGLDSGVSGSPTIFIDGQEAVGVKPIEYYENIIDKELGRS